MFLEELKVPEREDWWAVRAALEDWAFRMVNANQFVAPGTIALFAMITPPDGWVKCDATSYDNTKFPDLFKVIGTTHGGTATTFQVPPSPYVAPANTVWMIKT